MPFDQSNVRAFVNPVTGRTFSGEKNIAALAATGLGPHWATFVQWKTSGRIVRKGEKGTVLFGRGFTFRVFEESQTQLVEARPTDVGAICKPDTDTMALAAWYVCDVASKLYWAGHADTLDRAMTAKVEAINARAPANDDAKPKPELVAGSPAWEAKRAKRDRKAHAQVAYVETVRARTAKPKTKADGLPKGWHRHPVTGWPVRYNGNDIRDVIPFGHDPKTLALVAAAYKTHGRIGAANTIAWLKSEGRTAEAGEYAKHVTARRSGEGRISYFYGAGRIDLCDIVEGVEIDPSGRERRIVGEPRKVEA